MTPMTVMTSRILVVDDEDLVRWSLRQELERAGFVVDEAATAGAAIEAATRDLPDLMLLDHRLPDRTGVEVLREIKQTLPRIPVVMLTAHASIDGAVEALREGAYDYLTKPFEIDDVLRSVRRATETGQLREEIARSRERGVREFGLRNVIAESASMREVVRMVQRVAVSEASTILLLGESGVGKGLIARALHVEGAARDKPFQNITCTALPETLLESELFGHERGAFTDAQAAEEGPVRAGRRRHGVPRRDRRPVAAPAGQIAAFSRGKGRSGGSAARATSASACGSSRRRTRTSNKRSARAASGATSTSDCA
jgi:two-component system response regulator AtoC